MEKKKLSEHTERELTEKILLYSKLTSENTTFIKNFLIVWIVLSIIGAVILGVALS
jgi:hypothetical protein